jgi:hypothetical protein
MWETGKLAEEIKNKSLTQNDIKNYYLTISLIGLINGYFAILEIPEAFSNALIFEAVSSIFITIIGLDVIFNANLGNQGTDYINRVVLLSFPLLIKVILISSLFVIAFGAAGELDNYLIRDGWVVAIYSVITQIVVFWRIKIYIQYINS